MRGRRSASTASATGAPGSRRAVTVGEPSGGARRPRRRPRVARGPLPRGLLRPGGPVARPDFYDAPRLVHHIDERAVDGVGALYEELGVDGDVLDLMSSWVSHLRARRARSPSSAQRGELAANPMATARVVQDLNADPRCRSPTRPSTPCSTACPSTTSSGPSSAGRGSPGAAAGRAVGVHVLQPVLPTKAVRGWLSVPEERGPASSPTTTGSPAASTSRSRAAAGRDLAVRPAVGGLGPPPCA
jgi:hypothetical protein